MTGNPSMMRCPAHVQPGQSGMAALIVSKEGTDDWMTEKQARRELSIANEAAAVVAVSKAAAESLRRAGRVLPA